MSGSIATIRFTRFLPYLSFVGLLYSFLYSTPLLANDAPVCTGAYPAESSLWPPNHKLKSIQILGISDPDGDPLDIAVQCIRQDEPLNSTGDGNTDVDASGIGSDTAQVRAERKQNGNGRVYRVNFSATDPLGARCLGQVSVGVPKNKKSTAVDDGPIYHSSPDNVADCDRGIGEILSIDSTPPRTVYLNEPFLYTVQVSSNQPQAVIHYALTQAPDGAGIDALTGEISWQPSALGDYTFIVRASSDQGSVVTHVFSVLVEIPPNQAPIADDLTIIGDEDTAVSISLSASDADGDALNFTIPEAPQHGSLSGTAPNLQYQPDPDYAGSDSFTYRANDGQADSNTATVYLTIAPVNDAPIAEAQAVTGQEDTPLQITLQANDLDHDIINLSYSVISQPDHGTLSGTAPNLIYTPDADYHGTDQFSFVANDGTVNSEAANIEIEILPINDAPTAQTQSLTLDEDTSIAIVLSGTDPDSDPLTFTIDSQPANGTLAGSGENWVYTPLENYHGQDAFTFHVNDGQIDSVSSTVGLTVKPVNDAPTTSNQILEIDQGNSLNIVLDGEDVDGNTLVFTITQSVQHGVLQGSGNSYTYTPNADFTVPTVCSFLYLTVLLLPRQVN